MRRIVSSLLVVGLAACTAVGGEERGSQERGGLTLALRALGNAGDGVERVIVEWWDEPEDRSLELNFDSTTGQWTGVVEALEVGTYVGKATAYGADEARLFRSSDQLFTIQKGLVTSVLFLMQEIAADQEHVPPHFTSITFDRDLVEQDEELMMSFRADGSPGLLFLNGRHDQSDIDAGRAGRFTLTAIPMIGWDEERFGSLIWLPPPVPGPSRFILMVHDISFSHYSEVAVTMQVGADRGGAEFGVAWNLAPTVGVKSRLLNDDDAATLRIWVDVADDSNEPVNYEWTNDCGMSFRSEGLPASGTLHAPVEAAYFEADVARASAPEACSMVLRVTDSQGLSRSQTLELYPGLVVPVRPE
jgi:hypothetical protein